MSRVVLLLGLGLIVFAFFVGPQREALWQALGISAAPPVDTTGTLMAGLPPLGTRPVRADGQPLQEARA